MATVISKVLINVYQIHFVHSIVQKVFDRNTRIYNMANQTPSHESAANVGINSEYFDGIRLRGDRLYVWLVFQRVIGLSILIALSL